MSTVEIGILYVVSTPIGNLKDINNRALDILSEVDYILCEDTRVTKRILNQYNITSKLVSYNESSEIRKIPKVVEDLNKNYLMVAQTQIMLRYLLLLQELDIH